jgi:hypothetical protein
MLPTNYPSPTGYYDPQFQREVDRMTQGAVLDIATIVMAIASKPAESAFAAIRLIRAAGAGRFSEQLNREFSEFVAKGRIKDDYTQTDQARVLLGDTLESISDQNLDVEQLDLLKRLFLAAASEKITDRNDILAREYLSIGRSLSAGEIRMLAACYMYLPEWQTVTQGRSQPEGLLASDWMSVMKSKTGLQFEALIDRNGRTLEQKDLLRGKGGTGHYLVSLATIGLRILGSRFATSCRNTTKSNLSPPRVRNPKHIRPLRILFAP